MYMSCTCFTIMYMLLTSSFPELLPAFFPTMYMFVQNSKKNNSLFIEIGQSHMRLPCKYDHNSVKSISTELGVWKENITQILLLNGMLWYMHYHLVYKVEQGNCPLHICSFLGDMPLPLNYKHLRLSPLLSSRTSRYTTEEALSDDQDNI